MQSKRTEDERLTNWNREIIVDSLLGSFRFENIASGTNPTLQTLANRMRGCQPENALGIHRTREKDTGNLWSSVSRVGNAVVQRRSLEIIGEPLEILLHHSDS
jgi:hypothetical protein